MKIGVNLHNYGPFASHRAQRRPRHCQVAGRKFESCRGHGGLYVARWFHAGLGAHGCAQRRRGARARRWALAHATHSTASGIASSRAGAIASPHASQRP
ncbi:MAG: hypothetical protein JWN32_182 [Solirubrobacterales bacterium]|nr:hypothetical protein [Solirubrobacterales bacterium]